MNNNMIKQLYNTRFKFNRLLKMNISYCYNKPLNNHNNFIIDNKDNIKDKQKVFPVELKDKDKLNNLYNSLDMIDIPIISHNKKKYDHFNKPLYD